MLKSETVDALAAALCATQAEVMDVVKNEKATGQKFSYTYADLGAVLEMARPIWTKHGLSIVQFPVSDDGKVGVETTVLHTSGQWIQNIVGFPVEGDGRMSMSQAAGSIITYARRYSLCAVLAVAQIDDDAPPESERKTGKPPEQKGSPEPEKAAEKKDWKPGAIASIVEQAGKLLDSVKSASVGIAAVHEVMTAHGVTITPEEISLRDGTLKERLAQIPNREKAGEIFRELQARLPK